MSMSIQNKSIQKREPRIGPTSKAIIASIALVGAVPLLALFPGMALAIAPFIKKKRNTQKQSIQRSVESLVRTGLVKKIIEEDGSVQLMLTKRGKWHALLRCKTQDVKEVVWDKLWRVVIFDVPQSKNKMRAELRTAMKLYGFKMLQQSVWVYPHACDDFIEILKNHLGVTHDILYMKVSYIENDQHLRKEFKIG